MDNYNLIHCVKGKKYDSLNDLLGQLEEEKINDIYYYLFDKEVKMNKNLLIKKISKKLLNKEIIEGIIYNLINDEFNLLQKIIDNNGIINDNNFIISNCILLQCRGILYLVSENDEAYLIIPKEIVEIVSRIDLESLRNQVQKNTRLLDLASAMVNLYGVVNVQDYIDACFKYYNYDNIMEINIVSVLDPSRFNSIVVFDLEDNKYLSKAEYMEPGSYELLQSKIYDSEYQFLKTKDISISELLPYSDLYYFGSNEEIDKLRKYLNKQGLNNSDINDILSLIIQTIRTDYSSGIYFIKEILNDYGIELNIKKINELITLINNIYYSIPVWGSKGWTMKEILLSDFN